MADFKNEHDINLSNKRKRIQSKGFISKQGEKKPNVKTD